MNAANKNAKSKTMDYKQFEGHTPGRWRWELNVKSKQIQLCGGKRPFDLTVMDFVRWGMSGAKPRVLDPRHPDHMLLEGVEQFAKVVEGREHHADWFQNVDTPDLNLIAAAPSLLARCQELEREVEHARTYYNALREAVLVLAEKMTNHAKIDAEKAREYEDEQDSIYYHYQGRVSAFSAAIRWAIDLVKESDAARAALKNDKV